MPVLTCRTDEGGVPLCPRALRCHTVEIRGKSLLDISLDRFHSKRDDPTTPPEACDIVVVCNSLSFEDERKGLGNSRMFGKLLDLFTKAEINLARVWVSPLVRCYTDKKATVKEINTCSALLMQEIQRVDPKCVLLLGVPSLRLFRLHNKGGLKYIRGEQYVLPLPNQDINKVYNIIPSYDPSMFFREDSPMLEERVVSDYRKAALLADNKPIGDRAKLAKFEVIKDIPSLEKLVDQIKEEKYFAYDTEYPTVPGYKHPIICISISLGIGKNYIIPIRQHDPDGVEYKLKDYWNPGFLSKVLQLLKSIFENPEISMGGHNVKGDEIILRRWLDIKPKGFIFDSMLMHHLLHEYKPHTLEHLADIELAVGNYSEELHTIVGYGKELKNTYDHVPDEMMWLYAAMDAECTYRLIEIYYKRLQEKSHLWKLYIEETEPASHAFIKAEWFGHKIDLNTHALLVKDYTERFHSLLADIRAETWPDFNPNSSQQCVKAVTAAGFMDRIRDEKAASGFSTDKERLENLKRDFPVAGWIVECRNTSKMLGTYLKVMANDVDPDSRIRPSFWLPGTESGRIACRLFHQLPRVDKKRKHNIKDAFVSEEGYSLVYADLSQVELRVLALLANDLAMLNEFYPDGLDKPNLKADLHTETAAIMLGIPKDEISDFNRQEVGKPVNFGIAYGSTGATLVKKGQWEDRKGNRKPITWDMFNEGFERFKEKYFGLTRYLNDVPLITRSQGNIYCTPFGRERRMGIKLDDPDFGSRHAAEREIVNFTIQSPAGALTLRIINRIDKILDGFIETGQLKENDIYLVNNVHDSMTYEVKDYLVDWFKELLKVEIHRPVTELANAVFPGDIGVGKTATEAEANSK